MKTRFMHRDTLKDLEFQNILLGRITTTTNIVEWRDSDIEQQLRTIIEMIEQELDE